MFSQAWFEMGDVKGVTYHGDEWTPLWVYDVSKEGEMFSSSYKEEIYRVRTLFAPIRNKSSLFERWLDIDSDDVYACVDRGNYCKPGTYYLDSRIDWVGGEYTVFRYGIASGETSELQINQDFIAALKLVPKEDCWVRPCESNQVVIKIEKSGNGKPASVLVRTECLRDYLCARGMGLYLEEFRHRQMQDKDGRGINWMKSPVVEHRYKSDGNAQYEWKGWLFKHFDHHQWEDVHSVEEEVLPGSQYYRIEGQLWKQIWINPASSSGRVAGDDIAYEYYVLPDGTKHKISTLDDDKYGHVYLFFRPDVIRHVLSVGAQIQWDARDVFSIKFPSGQDAMFGISKKGSCFSISADIARLEPWEQSVLHGDNIKPEAQSEYEECELFKNQMMCEFLSTRAPEIEFPKALEALGVIFKKKTDLDLWRDSDFRAVSVSRFVSEDRDGYVALAKLITAAMIERMNTASLKAVINGAIETKQLGSISLLSEALRVVDPKIDWTQAIGFMKDVNYTRQAAAHLMPEEEIEKRVQAVRMDAGISWIERGARLIDYANQGLVSIMQALK